MLNMAFELRLLVEKLLRRCPDHGVIGRRRTWLPKLTSACGKAARRPASQGCRLGVGATETDSHGSVLSHACSGCHFQLSNSAPSITWSPGAYSSSATTPSAGAAMVCSIFMASITASGWPLLTLSPALTANDTTLPGIGAVRRPPSTWLSPAWASASIAMICVAPCAVNTWATSPFLYTLTIWRWRRKAHIDAAPLAQTVSAARLARHRSCNAPSCKVVSCTVCTWP